MFSTKRAYWRKLDNAAKIFPATSGKNDTRVFRFYCELKEQIDRDVLQRALDKTVDKYPVFLSVMRKGLFWHYLEKSSLRPVAEEESKEPCRNIYIRDKKSLLFEVTYYHNRINFEVYHALTDGTGATEFLRELVKNYLIEAHPEANLPDVALTDENITIQDQETDSFSKYYSKDAPKHKKKKIRAYQIRGMLRERGSLQVTEGTLSVKQALEKAREYGVSLTVLFASALICAIHEEMPKRQEKKPIVLMVPVNLRKFFPSESMLNFFGWIEPGYRFDTENNRFEDVLAAVKDYFKSELTKEKRAAHMNELISLERHPILRLVPLELKNLCMNTGARLEGRDITAIYSNMSIVQMPEEFVPYIERFGVFTSTPKVELCMCSFQETISLGFTSRYDSMNIQRNFFRILSEIGIEYKIKAPDYPEEKKESYAGLKFFKIFSFCCIAAAVITAAVNVTATPDKLWGLFVAGGILSMWLALAVGYFKRNNLLKNAMWQLLIVTLGCIIWDLFTGWHRWSVNYVLPTVSVVIVISMLIISKIQSLEPREYMIYEVMAAGYGLILSMIFILTHVVRVMYPSVICAGFSFLFLTALALFRHREFKEEMHKKFHI